MSIKHSLFTVLITAILFSANMSCKKKETVNSSKLDFTLNTKEAYENFEEIIVTNTSIGFKDFEWYINDVLVSDKLVITRDQLKNLQKNKKHELKLVGINDQGMVKTYTDSFIYRDVFKFSSVRFYNLRGKIHDNPDTTLWKPAIILLDNSTFYRGFHNPPSENCLISHVWTKDSFLSSQNNFRAPRSNDFGVQIYSKENYLSTKIYDTTTHSLRYSYMLKSGAGKVNGGTIPIQKVIFDRINKTFSIVTKEFDIQLRVNN